MGESAKRRAFRYDITRTENVRTYIPGEVRTEGSERTKTV